MKILRRVFILPIRMYQKCISPFFPRRCCYYPTCSAYTAEALRRHGLVKGGFISLRRIMRCHPFASCAYDPVPETVTLYSRSSSDTKEHHIKQ